jgi:hypothetical protein
MKLPTSYEEHEEQLEDRKRLALQEYYEERLALKLKHIKLVLAKQLDKNNDFAYRRVDSMFSRAKK